MNSSIRLPLGFSNSSSKASHCRKSILTTQPYLCYCMVSSLVWKLDGSRRGASKYSEIWRRLIWSLCRDIIQGKVGRWLVRIYPERLNSRRSLFSLPNMLSRIIVTLATGGDYALAISELQVFQCPRPCPYYV